PFAITKSLVPHGGLYPPYLELTAADVPLGVLIVMWATDSVMRKTPLWPPAPWGSLMLAILVWVLISTAVTDDWIAGTVGAVNQTRFLLHFAVLYSLVKTPRILRRVLTVAGAGLALNLFMVTAQMATQSPLALQGAKASAGAQIYSAIEG